MNCVLSDSQMKLLSLVRQNGGEMDVMKLSSFQCRSIRPLIDAGFLRYVRCGQCVGCQYGESLSEDWHCYKLRIKATT